ncbi:HAMP domain-containing protein [Caulobacter segnis]
MPGAAGLWRDLTDNVNELAANLTTQVRAIAEVSTAVTKGDLTRSITVEASGEVAALKDNINEMIRNLKDQTLKNTEQDWPKTATWPGSAACCRASATSSTVSNLVLSELRPADQRPARVFYVLRHRRDRAEAVLTLAASYAGNRRKPPAAAAAPARGLDRPVRGRGRSASC